MSKVEKKYPDSRKKKKKYKTPGNYILKGILLLARTPWLVGMVASLAKVRRGFGR